MILDSSRTTHESFVLSKPPACIHGISGYTHAKHEEHDTSCTATEASSWPIIFLRCQVINTAMLVVFWWSSWMIMDNHNFWEALGNSPNKETRRGNKAVFDNTVPYPFWNHWSFGQRPNGNHVTDHIKYLFLLNMSRLISEGMLRGLDFPGNFSEFM